MLDAGSLFAKIKHWITLDNNKTTIILSIIASVLFVILGGFLVKIYQIGKKRFSALRYFLPFNLDKKISIARYFIPFNFNKSAIYICYGLVKPLNNVTYFTVEEGDLCATYTIINLMANNYGYTNIKVLNDKAASVISSEVAEILCISGPLWNRQTEHYFGVIGSPVIFDRRTHNIIWTMQDGTKKEFSTSYTHRSKPHICHGIIVVSEIELPDGRKQKVVICAGNSSLSTYGISVFLQKLSRNRSFKKILKKEGFKKRTRIKKNKKYGLVLRIEDKSASPLSSSVFDPINTQYLDIQIKGVIPSSDFKTPFNYNYKDTN